MVDRHSQQLGKLIANQEALLKTVEKLERKIDSQATEIQDLKMTIANIRAGGRALLWAAGALGAVLSFMSTWAWRFWQAG